MFASPSTPTRYKNSTPHYFTPNRSSPLSPRSSHNGFNIATAGSSCLLPSPPQSPPSFLRPKRLFKPNLLSQTQCDERTTRRELFLKKVHTGREDKFLKSRGGEDEMMRMIFIAEYKRWEASLEKAASNIPTIYEEEEILDDNFSDLVALAQEAEMQPESLSYPEPTHQFEDFDDYLDRDGQELEGLLSQMDLDLDRKI
ncbi:hypothetical protein EDC01DRAFT_488681 [Geopyxis carbonaria]|nr:hypothetical protein EDC01DRAFT_488681 [Geopyxis carbonaria]